MANTVCRACSGFGHRSRDCPTNLRLGVLASASVQNQRLVHYARTRTEQVLLERTADLVELPSYHQVPKSIGRKRTHALAFPGIK